MQYKIVAVSPKVREYPTKFGDMKAYRVKFEGMEEVVEISQKASTAAPTEGQVLEGTIDMSGPYGPKFKKEYSSGGFSASAGTAPQRSANGGSKGGFQSDPFTMYLSYAKDIAVALISTKEGFDQGKFASILEDVLTGGKTLYDGRPGAEGSKPEEPKDKLPDENWEDMSKVDEVFGKTDEPIDTSDIPF